jgi:catecholate siderophore receptor
MFVVAGARSITSISTSNNRNGEDLRRMTDSYRLERVDHKTVSALSVYANYGVAYLPSSGDQFSSLTSITQQVKPEKFSNYELGAKWDIRSNLSTTALSTRQNEHTSYRSKRSNSHCPNR